MLQIIHEVERDRIAAIIVNEDFCYESYENRGKKNNWKEIKNNQHPFGEL